MKSIARKIFNRLPSFFRDYIEWIFSDASENQIRIAKLKKDTFSSFTQLKKHQKRARRIVALFFLVLFSLLVGLLVGPTLFPQSIDPEVYIPNGKGDILVGNISKNQVTVFFETLDGANNNKPLAATATVEIYEDKAMTKLVRRVNEDHYAVAHIIAVDGLQENNIYYIRIIAKDSSEIPHISTISVWGENEPIQFYTTGDLIPVCAVQNETREELENIAEIEKAEKNIVETLPESNLDNRESDVQMSALHILNVQNENHLQPQNKVQTIISWNTNIPATTEIVYGEGSSGERKELISNNEKSIKHAVVLTTLKTGTTYYFKTRSIDKDGAVAISDEYSLRTPKPKETIVEKISENFKGLLKQIKPN